MPEQSLSVYIGYDSREALAWEVCARSLAAHASRPVNIIKLDLRWLRRIGLYKRTFYEINGQRYDTADRRPFSTEFSFSRFLVPSLQPSGRAVFVDSDFLWRDDIYRMTDDTDPSVAVSVVQHNYRPAAGVKMRGQVQEPTRRKNWSSLMVFNCGDPQLASLTVRAASEESGAWLHGFDWVADSAIGSLNERWNWLVGHSPDTINPGAAHFTLGTPDMPGYEDQPYADEWREIAKDI